MKKKNILLLSAVAVSAFAMAIGSSRATASFAYYDPDDSEWDQVETLLKIENYEYDEEGKAYLASVDEFERSATGKPLVCMGTTYSPTGEAESYTKSAYEYDSNENAIRYDEGKYDPATGEWKKNWGDEYEYDSDNRCILHANYKNVSDGIRNYYNKYTYEYTNNLLTKVCTYGMSQPSEITSHDQLELLSSETYEYYENGLLKTKSENNETQTLLGKPLVNATRDYEYNSAGLQTKEVYKQWTPNDNHDGYDCFNCSIRTDVYDNNNKVTEHRDVYYDDDSLVWINSVSVTRYTYDGDTETSVFYHGGSSYVSDDDLSIDSKIVHTRNNTVNESKHYDYEDGNFVYQPDYSEKFVSEESNGRMYKVVAYAAVDENNWEEIYYMVLTHTAVASSGFPFWVIPVGVVVLAIAAYVCGYFFFYAKGKATGKFFDTIYTWFKNLLAKLNKKEN